MSRTLNRELAAEFLGTFVLIAFGVGVVAQTVLSANSNGSYLAINLGWGIAVTFGVLLAVSGAHLNPAVTVALAVHRGLPWRKVVPYALAQILGPLRRRRSSISPTTKRSPPSMAESARSRAPTGLRASSRRIRRRSCRQPAGWSIRLPAPRFS
jgi:hypothetical protein